MNKNISFLEKYFTVKQFEFAKIHFLYAIKYDFPRILISAAISLISYFFTSILSPRRKNMKEYKNRISIAFFYYLSTDLNKSQKLLALNTISKNIK